MRQHKPILGCKDKARHCPEDGRVLYWDLVEADLMDSFQVGCWQHTSVARNCRARIRGAAAAQAHHAVICSLAMHPEGTCLLTSSVDGTVKVWG